MIKIWFLMFIGKISFLKIRKLREMHPYSDKLKEINHQPLSDWIKTYKSLNNYEAKNRVYLMNFVFNKLAVAFGGFKHFWEDEKEEKFVIQSWIDICGDLTCPEVVSGLYAILKAKTEFLTRPPRNPMEFYCVCKNSEKLSIDGFLRIEKKYESSKEVAKENIDKIKNIINNSLCLIPRGK